MTETIQLLKPGDGTPGQIVACYPTPSEHFVITAEGTISFKPVWNLTHKKTTAKALGPFETQHEVRLMAGIFAGLPIPWDQITVEDIIGKKATQQKFRLAWNALPKEIVKWRQVVGEACASFYLDLLDQQERECPLFEEGEKS